MIFAYYLEVVQVFSFFRLGYGKRVFQLAGIVLLTTVIFYFLKFIFYLEYLHHQPNSSIRHLPEWPTYRSVFSARNSIGEHLQTSQSVVIFGKLRL